MKKKILVIIFLIILSGCDAPEFNGPWEMNLDLKIYNKDLSYEPVRIESLPLNIVLQKDGSLIYIMPAPYLKGGFTGKGYIKDGVFSFKSSAFEEVFFIEEISMAVQDLDFQCTGDISPEEDYMFGEVKGTLTLISADEERFACNIEEGHFIMRKKGKKD